jgi:hypothetical protein
MRLDWDGVPWATGYLVEGRAKDSTFSIVGTTSAWTTSFEEYSLNPATFHEYRVTALSSAGNSISCRPVSAVTLADGTFVHLEAEQADIKQGVLTEKESIGSADYDDYVAFHGLDFDPGYTRFVTRMAVPSSYAGQTVEVRLGSPSGTLIGQLLTIGTGGWTTFAEQTTPLSNAAGRHSLYIVFKGGSGVGAFDWFRLEGPSNVAPPTTLIKNGGFEKDSVSTFGEANSELPGTALYAGANDGYYTAADWSKTHRVWFVQKGSETFPEGSYAYRIDGDFYGTKDVLAQGGLSLVAGKTYRLIFSMWGEVWGQSTEKLDVRITNNPSSLTDPASGTGTLILNDKTTATNDQAAETVTVLFTPSVTSANHALQFIADSEEGETNGDHIWVDNIVLTEVVSQINPPVAGSYADWALTHGVAGAANGDSDNDGVENGVEYFMGITATDPALTSNPVPDSTNTVSWPMSASFSGSYEVETSENLETWTPVTPRPVAVGGYLDYTLPPGVPGGRIFLRLVVTPN